MCVSSLARAPPPIDCGDNYSRQQVGSGPDTIFHLKKKIGRIFFSGAASVLKKSSIIFLMEESFIPLVIVVVAMKNNDKSSYSFYSIITPRLKSPRTIKILDFSTTTIAAE